MSAITKLSKELERLEQKFAPAVKVGFEMSAEEARNLVIHLTILRRLAAAMETELCVHRLGEAMIEGRRAIEQLATDKLGQLIFDPDGKVIRPDFGRK